MVFPDFMSSFSNLTSNFQISDFETAHYLVADVCAILYENSYYNGSVYKVSETDSENILANFDNVASSLKVRDGCIFKGYNNINAEELLFATNDDEEFLRNYDNAISSYSCHCSPSKIFCYQLEKIN